MVPEAMIRCLDISQHLALLRPDPKVAIQHLCAGVGPVLSTMRSASFDAARYGGTKQQLSLDDIREVAIPSCCRLASNRP